MLLPRAHFRPMATVPYTASKTLPTPNEAITQYVQQELHGTKMVREVMQVEL